MLSHTRTLTLVALAGLGASVATAPAHAQSFGHIDRLAVQLERQAGQLHREVHAHFRNTPQYRHLDADVTSLEKLARHIHSLVDSRAPVGHVRRDVDELDRVYHHIQELVGEMARYRELDRQAYRHLQNDLRGIGTTLHHLRDDLAGIDVHSGPGGLPRRR